MERDRDDTEQEFMKEVADDFGYVPRNERDQGLKKVDLKSGPGLLICAGAGILFLIVIGLFLFAGGEAQVSREDIAALKADISRIEKNLARLKGMEKRLVDLEKEQKRLRQTVSRVARASNTKKKKRPSTKARPRYHTVRAGESLYTIARKYGISTDKLCRLNKITPKKLIKPGQKLVVGP